MTQKIRIADLPEFDLTEHLKSEEDIAAYLTAVIEEGDSAELVHALGLAAGGASRSCVSLRRLSNML